LLLAVNDRAGHGTFKKAVTAGLPMGTIPEDWQLFKAGIAPTGD